MRADSRPPAGRTAYSNVGEIRLVDQLDAVSFLGGRLLLAVVSSTKHTLDRKIRGWLLHEDRARRVAGSRILLGSNGSGEAAELLMLHPDARREPLPEQGQVVLETPEGPVGLEPKIEHVTVSLERLGSNHLAKLDADTRTELLDRLASAVGRQSRGSTEVSQGLRSLRDAVRPRLPHGAVGAAADHAVHVDGLWRISGSSFYIKGWIFARAADLDHLRLLTPEGCAIDILGDEFRYPRQDVADFFNVSPRERLGFIAYVEAPIESALASGWIIEVGQRHGRRIEAEAPAVVDDPLSVRTMLLQDLQAEQLPSASLRVQHIKPALARLEERRAEGVEIDMIDQLGSPPQAPEVTVIVPLYQRMDFLEQQMAQFVHDPEIRSADLVYVLDSPDQAEYLRSVARELFNLYGVPFRLVILSANGGFALANNVGASLARGRMLLLLNSDVLPDTPGWLSRMIEFYDANPMIGALAPKLLYEDQSIQHAGLYFDRPPGGYVWSNEHYFKGLHRDFPAANLARSVPAVTGACLMISTELYRELGGLRGAYLRGDYEDSDLCLRLHEMGRETWYMPDVELYHLEGQSYPTHERSLTSDYNKWLQTHQWAEELAAQADDGAARIR